MNMNTNNQSIVPVSVEDLTQNVLSPDLIVKADDWESCMGLWFIADEIEHKTQWYKGEIANKVATIYGENSLNKFASDVNTPYHTIVAYRRTIRAYEIGKRSPKLTWAHHFIASQVDTWDKDKKEFNTNERFKWIEKADDENWSTFRLRKEIAEHKAKESPDTLFQYYSNAINSFGAIIKKWDINQLNNQQKEELVISLDNIVSNFKSQLLISESKSDLLTLNT